MNSHRHPFTKEQNGRARQGPSRVVQVMLGDALRHHQSGRLAEAERIYRQILAIDAHHADSLHLLGVIACQGGRYEIGVDLIGRAIRLKHNASYLYNMANALNAQGHIDDAVVHYQRALVLDPDYADAHNNLGSVLLAQGKLDDAMAHFGQALASNPKHAEAHNNLGNALVAKGRIDDAIAHYERALVLNPGHVNAHNNLGIALVAKGRIDDAVAHYERALVLDPGHANAHNNLGIALVAKGRIDDAVAHYERALVLNPGHADAHNNLGIALGEQGRIDDAVAHYERALVLSPDHADAHNNLGIALVARGRIDDAAAHYERALVLNPEHANAHNNLGNVFTIQGRFDDAIAHYGRAIAIRPDYAEPHYNRAEIKRFQHDDADLAALEALAERDDLPANKALHIHFALAKALEDCGDYSRAFEHLSKGNALKRRQTNYDEETVIRRFERISTVFDRSLFDRFQGEGDPSSVPIFVLGMPRSGSTLIEQILASHPQIHGAGELADLEVAVSSALSAEDRTVQYPECVSALDGAALRRFGQSYLAHLLALADGKVRAIDKLPSNFLNIGLIRLILPNAKIIHTMRHPMDTCVSCYSKLFTVGVDFSYDLAELGRYYRCYRALMAHWRSVLPPGAMLDVAYEDTVDDLEGQARRMIDYCGLPWDDRCLSFHKTSRPVKTASAVQVRKPLFRDSLQRWRRHEANLAPLLHVLGNLIASPAPVQACGPEDAQSGGSDSSFQSVNSTGQRRIPR